MTAPALVESEADARMPGRTGYRITSLYSPEAVQRAISEIMQADGVQRAEFTRPTRVRGDGGAYWGALGYTVTVPAGAAA